MKTMKKHKHESNTSITSGITAKGSRHWRIPFIAVLVGILSVIIALSIGYVTYRFTLKITEKRFQSFYMNKAKMLASEVELYKEIPDDIVLSRIDKLWRVSGDKPPDEYICIVDSDARLILHTGNPDTVGNKVGHNPLLLEDNSRIDNLLGLVKSQGDCVGGYVSSAGQEQIAAFAAIPERGWAIGVHRSREALTKEIKSSIWFLALGFTTVCGFLLPTSLIILYLTFRSSHWKRMKVEEELIRAERLAGLGKLSSGIAHEIRNPLAIISTSAYYLKQKLKDADEKNKTHLDRIINQVKNSTAIIQSLQNLTKMKEPERVRMDIVKAIEDGINISNIPQTVSVVRNLPEGEFFVNIDLKQISMVFKNILTNAIQAMGDEGTIWINADKVSDKWVEVSFTDSGPGIEQESLKKIFQPFFGTKTKGFGFGLTLCQMIMEKHGGEIKAQSEVGKETTFIVRFPCSLSIYRT